MKTSYLFKPLFTAFLAVIILSSNAQVYSYNSCNFAGKKQYKYSDNFTNYEVQVKGDIEVTDDDSGIKSISPGGSLKISKKTFGNKRSIIIESSSNGSMNYEYYEGRSQVPYDPEGKKWLAEILLDVVRMTGIDAEGRTKRIHTKHGVDGVLEEINELSSNSVMALYFEALIENFDLSADENIAICSAISQDMSSNTERGNLYRKYSDVFMKNNTTAVVYFTNISKLSSNTERGSILKSIKSKIDFVDPKITEAYFGGVDKMTSNTERGSVLRNVENSQELTDQAYERLLVSVKKLSSNTEMGSVMRSLDKLDISRSAISTAWFNAIDGMSSNTEAGSTMRHLLKNHELNNENYTRLLASVKKLSSNTEKGSVMRSMDKLLLKNTSLTDAYFLAINSMTSNTETGSVLKYTLRTHELSNSAWINFFTVTGRMSSNTEMGSVLKAASEEMPYEDEAITDAFFAATSRLSSNTEHGSILKKIIDNPGFNKYTAYKLLESTRGISSNTEKGAVLVKLSNTEFVKDPEIKKMYLNAARTLTSDYEYRRVVEKLID